MKLIYIIEDGRGNKKIGMTNNIEQRVRQLETAVAVGIISVMVSDFMENARSIEKQLHEANQKYRLNGEWFSQIIDFCGIEFAYSKIDIAEGAMMTFQDSLEIIATDEDMTGQTLKVMLLLMSNLEFENYITIKQVTIAEKLKIDKADVSKAMKLLVAKGIILKVKEGTTTGYKLNPHYGWKGKVSNRDIELKRIAKQRVVDMKKYRDVTDKPNK
jgi:predicted XRE-type DNA-binding protein